MSSNLRNVFLYSLGIVLFYACSEKEDFSSFNSNTVEPINIGLTYRAASLRNQEITFQVFDEESNEIVDNITFYVDGSPIMGNTFSADQKGCSQFMLNMRIKEPCRLRIRRVFL